MDHSILLPQLQAIILGKKDHCKCKGNNKCMNLGGRFIREDTAEDQRS